MPSKTTPLAGTLTRRSADQTPRQRHRPSPEPVHPSGEDLSELRASLIGKLRQVNVQLFNTNAESSPEKATPEKSTPERSTPEKSTPENSPERSPAAVQREEAAQRRRRRACSNARLWARRPMFLMSLTEVEIDEDWYELNGVAGRCRLRRTRRQRINDGLFPGSKKKK